ncbi:UPF0271 protein [Microbacterium sorbitolivorans]|uniref:5-oxoprolinase subunit A n=1 Tax=Microbacterium sorbitolivorans TaxID=1867410 RepID=A0A367YAI2_9MICO|nr:5-oxoprolinase subunit PxpA [Microbacterium sorbitolivorans]RCK62042.1 LamB/YcsF family protein [Microbacterium sorbitolivorans]GGF43634.1 UPF0271 protein [Microbacterium sorbitolivorans]
MDLNSDVGESFGAWHMGDDAAMFAQVTSANIACGFHAGDPSGIARTARAAVAAGVTIGAHVGYRDLAGFGRRFIDYTETELSDEVAYQIGALQALARREGGEVRYVKPHGALYNAIVHHEAQARAVVDAVRSVDPSLALLLLPGSVAGRFARERGLRFVGEAFADRAYTPAGELVSRGQAGSVLTDAEAVSRRMVRFAVDGVIDAIDGTPLRIDAESICLHGDTPGAVTMASAVRRALDEAGAEIRSFA